MIDAELKLCLDGWQHHPWALRALFQHAELAKLEAARTGVRKDRWTIVFCVYENPFAKAGGLFSIASHLPQAVQRRGDKVLVLSPFHARLATAPQKPERPPTPTPRPNPLRWYRDLTVPFGGAAVDVTLWEQDVDGVRWILFEAAGFFEAPGGPKGNIPYDFSRPDGTTEQPRLDVDSLFASAAIPHILNALGLTEDLVIHAHDWQLAATALTVKEALLNGLLRTAAVVLTSHNPYDHGLPADRLRLITERVGDAQWPTLRTKVRGSGPLPTRRGSFYECLLPLLDAPLATVSKCFARELQTHPIHTDHFADHLQEVFQRQTIVGIDNGLFLKADVPAFSERAVDKARQDDTQDILEEKEAKRRVFLEHFSEYLPANTRGGLDDGQGGSLRALSPSVPIFMMFGRMDPAQKGFDVLARAVERIDPGQAKFIFALEAVGGIEPFVEDLRQLAERRSGDVVFIPDRMTKGYLDTMAGVSFCVMPSLYEPFGAATEPYLKGTPVVAHATGGLLQQVIDYTADPQHATGILYRPVYVPADPDEFEADWHALLDCSDPQERQKNPLYEPLVESLTEALTLAISLFNQHTPAYGRILANLHGQATRFSWDTAAAEYCALYDVATQAR
jgi:glycogen synthase